jgi:hypothetical protein
MSRPNATRRRPGATPLLALSLLVAASGCSFRVVRPPPARADWPARGSGNTSEIGCTATYGPAAADLIMATAAGTIGFVERNSGTSTAAIGLMVLALPFLASSVYGAYHATGCRRYQTAVYDAQTAP